MGVMMSAAKLLVSLPDELLTRFRALIPNRQRSLLIRQLIEKEIEKREKALYQQARLVEEDKSLQKEMDDWAITVHDGMKNNEAW